MDHKNLSLIGFGTGGIHARIENRDLLGQAVETALKCGYNFIDTAEVYGDGSSELAVGAAVKGMDRESVFIATKFSPEHNAPEKMRTALKQSLARLRTDYVDLYQMHWPNPEVPFEETLAALRQFKREGTIKNIGLCNLSYSELKKAIDFLGDDLFSLQMEYNLADRYVERDILPLCRANNVRFIAYYPLNRGKKLSKAGDARLSEITARSGISLPQLMLSWLIAKGVMPIPGSMNQAHIQDNIKAERIRLTDCDIEVLESIYPYDIKMIKPGDIRPIGSNSRQHNTYMNLSEAMDNIYNNAPSPKELSKVVEIEADKINPIRVVKDNEGYYLAEGKIRYWAWVIAFGWERPLPCIIRQNEEDM